VKLSFFFFSFYFFLICRVHVATFAHGRNSSAKDVLGIVQGIRDNNGRSKGKTELDLTEIFNFLSILTILVTNYSLSFQALGYEFDNDEFHAYVHGRLPYEVLKPDPVLRNLLLSMPQRKIVCQKGFPTLSHRFS
jgi:hypothetical protein